MPRRTAVLITFGIFAFLIAAYVASPVRTIADSRWVLQTAMSLIDGRGGDLTEYRVALQKHNNIAIEYIGGRPHTMFPAGVSILAMPAVAVASWVDPGFRAALRDDVLDKFDTMLACLFGAVAGTIFFWLILGQFQSLVIALASTAIFAFCTSMWSTATRALWQHGPLVLMFVIAMLLLQRARSRAGLIQYVSLPLAMAFLIRPTASIPIAILSAYVLLFYRQWFIRYVGWGMLVAIPWIAFNLWIYEAIFPPYYLGTSYAGTPTFGAALLGNLFSPGRGLFVYSPVLLFAVIGFAMSLRDANTRPLHIAYGMIVIATLAVMSFIPAWWAGHSFGPRYMTDLIPFLVYFTAFSLRVPLAFSRRGRIAWICGIVLLSGLSLLIHAQGAFRLAPYAWNAIPNDIDWNVTRLWDVSDPPFLRTENYQAPR